MRIFLIWPATDRHPIVRPLDEVRAELQARFQPLFADPLIFGHRSTPSAHLLWAEIPETNWKASSLQTGGQNGDGSSCWAFAPDYPMNAHVVLKRRGEQLADTQALLPLARSLQSQPQAVLSELMPPFSLIWNDAGSDDVLVQTDGLGQAAMFESTIGGVRVLTNHVAALGALGLDLEPLAEEWAARFSIGWFPMDMTGIANVRCAAPGARYRFHAGGVDRTSHDVLSAWVNPPSMTRAESIELAKESLLDMSRAVMPLWDRPTAGLSGGWDSRAVCAALRHVGADLNYRVRGHPERFDVLIAHHLSEIAGLGIRIKTSGGQPATNAEDTSRSIQGALLWQMGGMPAKRHKTFLVKHPRLKRGSVNVMGQHGGLGKADFVRDIGALELAPEQFEDHLVEFTLRGAPPNLRREHDEFVQAVVRRSFRAAERYGLSDLGALHFYYLNEFTRRWGSATVTSQTGLVFAPILNPGFIQAAYAYPEDAMCSKPFHRHVIKTLSPEWADVPYTDTVTEADLQSGRVPALPAGAVPEQAEEPAHRATGRYRKFHPKKFWKYTAPELVEEVRRSDGFWPLVFDPDRFDEGLPKRADEVVMAHLLPRVLSSSIPLAS